MDKSVDRDPGEFPGPGVSFFQPNEAGAGGSLAEAYLQVTGGPGTVANA